MQGLRLFQVAGRVAILFFLCCCIGVAGISAYAGSDDFCTRAETAEAELNRGMWHLTLQDFEAAIGSFNSGLAVLGADYLTASIDDDSDVKLLLADDMEGKGDLKGAAGMKRWVLTERLGHFKNKYRCG